MVVRDPLNKIGILYLYTNYPGEKDLNAYLNKELNQELQLI